MTALLKLVGNCIKVFWANCVLFLKQKVAEMKGTILYPQHSYFL